MRSNLHNLAPAWLLALLAAAGCEDEPSPHAPAPVSDAGPSEAGPTDARREDAEAGGAGPDDARSDGPGVSQRPGGTLPG